MADLELGEMAGRRASFLSSPALNHLNLRSAFNNEDDGDSESSTNNSSETMSTLGSARTPKKKPMMKRLNQHMPKAVLIVGLIYLFILHSHFGRTGVKDVVQKGMRLIAPEPGPQTVAERFEIPEPTDLSLQRLRDKGIHKRIDPSRSKLVQYGPTLVDTCPVVEGGYKIVMVFDAGPCCDKDKDYKVLQKLKAENATGSFFFNAQSLTKCKDIVHLALEDGHHVGMNGLRDEDMAGMSDAAIEARYDREKSIWERLIGVVPYTVLLPRGGVNQKLIDLYVRDGTYIISPDLIQYPRDRNVNIGLIEKPLAYNIQRDWITKGEYYLIGMHLCHVGYNIDGEFVGLWHFADMLVRAMIDINMSFATVDECFYEEDDYQL